MQGQRIARAPIAPTCSPNRGAPALEDVFRSSESAGGPHIPGVSVVPEPAPGPAPIDPTPDPAATAVARVSRHLIPFLFLLYILNFLDRVNVGFAALEMNRDLGFGPAVYGFGAGIFFLGYCLFEVPSNLVLYRTGARLWIARIMVTWGLAASAMMLVHAPWSFYVLRFLLGVAEAGFFPGIIFYLTYWYPARERARAYAWFLAAIPVSGVIGGPHLGRAARARRTGSACGAGSGSSCWRAFPRCSWVSRSCWLLPDRPRDARWLRPAERALARARLDAERATRRRPTARVCAGRWATRWSGGSA